MKGQRLTSLLVDQPVAERFDRSIEVLLMGLLAFAPLALGAVQAWSEQVVITLAAALSLLFLTKLALVRSARFVWSWAYVPVLAFILAVAFQLLPLPVPLVRALSPNTVALKNSLLGDGSETGSAFSSMALTFYSYATRHDLRLVLAVAAVFVVVVNVYQDPLRIRRLLAAIAVVGGAVVLLALAQDVAGNGKIYWLIPTYDRARSGTFINHSHYGQFVNLCIGAALGRLLASLHRAFRGRAVTPAGVAEYLSSPRAQVIKLLAATIVLGAATIFISLTRGGMISMLVAAAFTTVVLSSRQSLRGQSWIIVLLALGAFICVLYVGFDQVYDRLATLHEFDRAEGGRWQMVKGVASAWTRFPVLGTGLGTHQVVYPMFDRSHTTALATHAENEYAQTLEETGLIGLAALVAFGVFVWFQYGRCVMHPCIPMRSVAYGLGFGLMAILVHSLSDFGQHLPANALLSAVCCGLLIALRRIRPPAEEKEPVEALRRFPSLAGGLALLLAVGLWTWVWLDANAARVAESHWNKAFAAEQYLDADNWQTDDDQAYRYLISHASQAAAACPDSIHYRYWVNVYRWRSLERYLDPNTGELPPETLPFVRRIADELHQCRAVCPTFGAAYCVAGEIERLILKDPNGAADVRQGYRLAPCDPVACFAAARIDAEEGKADESYEKLCLAVELDEHYLQPAARLCIDVLNRTDLAVQLAGDDVGRLAAVSGLLVATGPSSGSQTPGTTAQPPAEARQQLAEQVTAALFEQLRLKCEQPDAPASAHASLARLCERVGELEAAIQHYRRALVKDYHQVGWHYALALLLARTDRVEEAAHEAQICLRLKSNYAPARRLIAQLAARPTTAQSSGLPEQ